MKTHKVQFGSTIVQMDPELDYSHSMNKMEYRSRSIVGKSYVFRSGAYESITFSVRYLSVADMVNLNTWWEDKVPVVFSFADSSSSFPCVVVNGGPPINTKELPYNDVFSGALELEAFEPFTEVVGFNILTEFGQNLMTELGEDLLLEGGV